MQIEGAVALVTGGGSGLGAATARALAARGATVVIADLPDAFAGTDAPEGLHAVPTDVTSDSDVERSVEFASSLGSLRLLVNCAGIGRPARITRRGEAAPMDSIRAEVAVNLLGTINVIRLALPAMTRTDAVDGERGVVINTASVAAFDGQVGQVGYAATKAGIAGITLPLARELAAHLIRVMTIAPGLFDTPLLAALPADVRTSLGLQVPHPSRLGRPEEYARLVESIATNPMLNGEVIRLDGAIRMAAR